MISLLVLTLTVSLLNISVVGLRGPGLIMVRDTYTAQCPMMSYCSMIIVVLNVPHCTWKYLKSSLSTSFSGVSPGGIFAGAAEKG